ncbi:hypothetical protein [Streptomyces sp. SAS_270]|uniref:hypothetical protein n=1 Tax=Streptomyces sp. SAS_270 TaxID=3412748 RepID=UPI00403C876A
MHAYDVPRRQSFQPVLSSRPAQDPPGGPSATPIYDALYKEWVRSFRALPGDRHGEEELGFTAFGSLPHGASAYGGSYSGGSFNSFSAYSAGAYNARHGAAQHATGHLATRSETGAGHAATATAVWQTSGRQHPTGMHHIPAALPPGPRRGF